MLFLSCSASWEICLYDLCYLQEADLQPPFSAFKLDNRFQELWYLSVLDLWLLLLSVGKASGDTLKKFSETYQAMIFSHYFPFLVHSTCISLSDFDTKLTHSYLALVCCVFYSKSIQATISKFNRCVFCANHVTATAPPNNFLLSYQLHVFP